FTSHRRVHRRRPHEHPGDWHLVDGAGKGSAVDGSRAARGPARGVRATAWRTDFAARYVGAAEGANRSIGGQGRLPHRTRRHGGWLRALAVITLLAVMFQGLLGGLRVRLNALYGKELAPVHGVFAQVVFCLLVALAALTGKPAAAGIPDSVRRLLGRLSLGLV